MNAGSVGSIAVSGVLVGSLCDALPEDSGVVTVKEPPRLGSGRMLACSHQISNVLTTSVATPGCVVSVSARLLANARRCGPLVGLPLTSVSGEARFSGSKRRVLQAGFLLLDAFPLTVKLVTRAGSGVNAFGLMTQMSSFPLGPVPTRGAEPPAKPAAFVVNATRWPSGDHAGE